MLRQLEQIFFCKRWSTFTPKPDCFLNGITRQTVISIAKKNKIKVNEDYLNIKFLSNCNEAFLTGTAVEISPVSSIDDYKFNDRIVTKKLIDEFKKEVLN